MGVLKIVELQNSGRVSSSWQQIPLDPFYSFGRCSNFPIRSLNFILIVGAHMVHSQVSKASSDSPCSSSFSTLTLFPTKLLEFFSVGKPLPVSTVVKQTQQKFTRQKWTKLQKSQAFFKQDCKGWWCSSWTQNKIYVQCKNNQRTY